MPNWIAITIDTLNEAKIAALVEACSTAALAEGQADRVPGKIQGVVNLVRNAIAGCPTRQLDEDIAKVPNSLRDLTVKLIIAELKDAIEQPLTEDERDTVAWCRRELKEIRSCDYPIESPDDAVEPEVQAADRIEVITKGSTKASPDNMDGLI